MRTAKDYANCMISFFIHHSSFFISRRKKPRDIAAEVCQFTHNTAADACQMRLGKEQYGLHASYHAVDVSLFALILKVLYAAHALYYEAGILAAGKVDGEI